MKTIISTNNAPAAIGPYSQANMVNGVLYISGQIPINPSNGELVTGIESETHQVMKNLEAILKEAGMSFSNVVKSTIFLKNMDDFSLVNDIYASYLDSTQLPARETVQVSRLPKDVNVEISMIAHQF
ncbi:RidA family protein [Riemerella anatipestifer]|uniref:RidA family protein n=1 Tax=Riemerella anatipestifer TaxID=34085 RepID=UPI0001F0E41D|nr:RidA family protein [Riemerella anatipestifer]AGC40050.1 Putative translation initiation inhibitor, yjgF family [Riemerella anatipestifer RA-CH-2]AKP69256.1 Putative translation initiation inhibitor, yjgF family [Riemerella anatipestifer]AKP71144.1 Putative translation initiation inhibitor, yjgF family [Riemerella anatipestifer]AKQ40238.1 dfrA [Riemerella anatipestifer Yb2]EFT36702.1 Endoribonuclease L-PSP [Riemerella anatipestifer RA-YM]